MSLECCMRRNRTYYISVVSLEMRYNTFWSSFVFLTCHFFCSFTLIFARALVFSMGKTVFFVKITSAAE